MSPAGLESQILAVIRRIARATNVRSQQLLQQCGLTAPQLAAMAAIHRQQALTPSRLAGELHLGQPTVTGILNRLESRGLLQRVRGDVDRRSVHVQLTDDGERTLASSPALYDPLFAARLAEFSPPLQDQMLTTLNLVADLLQTDGKTTGDDNANLLPADPFSLSLHDDSVQGDSMQGDSPKNGASKNSAPKNGAVQADGDSALNSQQAPRDGRPGRQ